MITYFYSKFYEAKLKVDTDENQPTMIKYDSSNKEQEIDPSTTVVTDIMAANNVITEQEYNSQ